MVWSSGGTAERTGEIVLRLSLRDGLGGSIPPGTISVQVRANGYASLGVDTGSASARARLVVSDVVVEEFPAGGAGEPPPPPDGIAELPVSGASPFAADCTAPGAQVGTEVEPQLAVNPTDPNNVIAVWQQDRFPSGGGARSNLAGVTVDGGKTWTPVVLPGISRCAGGEHERASDPWVSFGPDGMAYAVSLAVDGHGERNALLVNRSSDGGLAWSAPVAAAQDVALMLNDKESITADPTAAGYAYVVWAKFVDTPLETGAPVGTFLSRTTDGGATWSPPTLIYLSPGGVAQGNEIVVLPDGTLLDVFIDIGLVGRGSSIAVIRSSDKGQTWSAPIRIADASYDFYVYGSGGLVRAPTLPSAAVAPDGAVYVAWHDGWDGSVFLTRSTDGGLSWTVPTIVADEGTPFLPSVAVAADGTVGMTFYDFRNDSQYDETTHTDVWFKSSRDGGATWAEKHVAGPFDMDGAPYSNGRFVGDYHGLDSLGSEFGAVFGMATPTASQQAPDTDVYWARIAP